MSFSSSSNRRKTNVSILINVPFVWTRFYKVCIECEWTDKKKKKKKNSLKNSLRLCKRWEHDDCRHIKRVWPLLDNFDRCSRENDNGSWTLRVTCNAYCRHGKLICSVQGLSCFINSVQIARGWNERFLQVFCYTLHVKLFSS